MNQTDHTITLLPHGRKIMAAHGQSLMDALKTKNIILRSDCGGKGKCGKCRVEGIFGEGQPRQDILACTFAVTRDLCIEIPQAAMFSTHTIGKAAIALPSSFTDRFAKASSRGRYGVAVDLGTTTIAAYLCDMDLGRVLASASVKNPQALYGDDVMSRIGAVGQSLENLAHMQGLVVGAVEQAMADLRDAAGSKTMEISKMVVVGNPAMIHILTGTDPSCIGVSPYRPAFYAPKTLDAKDLGFSDKGIQLYTLPQVSGFIGGDILAAAVAVDLPAQPRGTLLIDLGTNGELMLKGRQGLFATSCATGPAFEGASLSCGMQAVPGAVNNVCIASPGALPEFDYIQGRKNSVKGPSGICGAGVVSAVAQFCAMNIIRPDGGFNPEALSRALAKDDSGRYRYTIAPGSREKRLPPVYISQKDIRSVQLGKGALITGIDFLLKKAGIDLPERLIVAGAFGSHLDQEDMKTLGMIPDLAGEKIYMAGNAAGTGAVMALCCDDYLEQAQAMAERIQVVDLASDRDFHASFIRRLAFTRS